MVVVWMLTERFVCEQTLDRKLRNERDTHTVLEREAARLRIEVETHSKRVARAQEVRPLSACCARARFSD